MSPLKHLYSLIKTAYQGDNSDELKQTIINSIDELKDSDLDIVKFKELFQRLNPKWSPKHLNLLLISLERILHLEILEHEFLVTTKDKPRKHKSFPVTLILENIRSSFNVGSIFRTAESFGVKKIYLCGYTSTPKNPRTLKTTMNSHEHISWEHKECVLELIKELKTKNYSIYALETSDKAKYIYDIEYSSEKPIALILGNERFGIQVKTLELAHEVLKIPNYGVKNSLNVSIAAGISISEIIKQMNHSI